jgi:hypothetical protein
MVEELLHATRQSPALHVKDTDTDISSHVLSAMVQLKKKMGLLVLAQGNFHLSTEVYWGWFWGT